MAVGSVQKQSPPKIKTGQLVLASYFAWYGDTTHWEKEVLTDHPKAGNYNSSNPAVIKQQIASAKSVGIDGFMVSWWGGKDNAKGDHSDGYIDENFQTILASANGTNFKIAVMFESDMEKLHGRDVGAELYYALTKYGNHPNYLKYNGKPVVFIYHPEAALGRDLNNWKVIFSKLRQNKADGFFLGDAFGKSGIFDGLWAFGPIGPIQQGKAALENSYAYGRSQAKSTGGIWMPTVMAGYDDRKFRSPGKYVSRTGCSGYKTCLDMTWKVALDSNPDWIHIGTWNEYHEATEIEASQEHGDTYLNIIKNLIQ